MRKIVFTGSTEVGQQIMAGCARQVKRLTLELGGKSANIVFADADLERAAATAPYAVFDNAGQDCCARSRILVQRSALDRFMELLEPAVKGVARRRSRRRPDRDGTADLGGAPGARGLLRAGRRAGGLPRQRARRARVLVPADRARAGAPDDRAYTEEVFGPVVTVTPFERRGRRGARIANDTPYGLSGSIWTRTSAARSGWPGR